MKVVIPNLKQDHRPLYAQVSDALSELILSQAYVPGEKLPSEEELAIQLGVSRPTLRVAIGYLESQGLLERRRGIGTFIAQPKEKQVNAEGLEEIETICETAERTGLSYERVAWHIEKVLAGEKIADLLKVTDHSSVIYVRYAFKLAGKLYAFFESWIPEDYVDLEALRVYPKKGLLDYLLECCPEKYSFTQTNVYARGAGDDITRWVGIPAGTPLLYMEELFILDSGQPFVYNLKYFDTSVMHFYLCRRFSSRR